jgi:hypothetical protein
MVIVRGGAGEGQLTNRSPLSVGKRSLEGAIRPEEVCPVKSANMSALHGTQQRPIVDVRSASLAVDEGRWIFLAALAQQDGEIVSGVQGLKHDELGRESRVGHGDSPPRGLHKYGCSRPASL